MWRAAYKPFGGVSTTTGTPPDNRFPGQWFQTESGLYQNWMRNYNPATGRYIQADPLGLVDGASVYGYVRGNPERWVDPRGESAFGAVSDAAGLDLRNPDKTDLNPYKWAGYGALAVGAAIYDYCASCAACSPYPAGTIGYIGPHLDHSHYPYKDHYNFFVVNQASDCKCYWNKNSPDSAGYPPNAPPSWVDLNAGFPPLTP